MVKGVLLTRRDQHLLDDCYRHGLLSIAQIRKRHFPGVKPPTVCNRLTKLRKAGVLRKQRVGVLIYHSEPEEVGTVYQITRKGIGYLKTRYPDIVFRDEPLRLNTSTLSHDLLITEALAALTARFPDHPVVLGRLFNGCSGATRIPDAVLLGDSGQAELAIELELTAKSERRYREITLQYQMNRDYPKVLYIVGSNSIAEKMKTIITGRKSHPGLPAISTSKFYFVSLGELLKSPRDARLTNGAESLALENKNQSKENN